MVPEARTVAAAQKGTAEAFSQVMAAVRGGERDQRIEQINQSMDSTLKQILSEERRANNRDEDEWIIPAAGGGE